MPAGKPERGSYSSAGSSSGRGYPKSSSSVPKPTTGKTRISKAEKFQWPSGKKLAKEQANMFKQPARIVKPSAAGKKYGNKMKNIPKG